MKLFRWLLIIPGVFAAIVAGGGFFLPAGIHMERSTVIEAWAAEIFSDVDNCRKFNGWSPRALRRPGPEYTSSGPEDGARAKMA